MLPYLITVAHLYLRPLSFRRLSTLFDETGLTSVTFVRARARIIEDEELVEFCSQEIRRMTDELAAASPDATAYALITSDGQKITVDSDCLADASPVFRQMIAETKRDGQSYSRVDDTADAIKAMLEMFEGGSRRKHSDSELLELSILAKKYDIYVIRVAVTLELT